MLSGAWQLDARPDAIELGHLFSASATPLRYRIFAGMPTQMSTVLDVAKASVGLSSLQVVSSNACCAGKAAGVEVRG
ncbi:hypothetical protein RQP53_02890 [Paucibacter sp. APW11]|uniref:Uncharacterized protein n=1 Tax=Roseateles aquae TaxID=3077235 RepID=A0ABU3P6L7_9BURK|nr:hypothetical protein [Paucibacter sp. APW11]MDT8998217.1 hypothetical protein [Paucibacter sp. APW11]